MLALVGATLYVLEIRDVRCYAAAAIWVPTISGMSARERLDSSRVRARGRLEVPRRLSGLRRSHWGSPCPRSCSSGPSSSGCSRRAGSARPRSRSPSERVVTVVAWAIIGFAGLGEYPDLLRRLSELQSERSYSIVGMAATLGVGEGVGRAATLVVGGALLVACVLLARRGRRGAFVHVRGGGDARAEPDRLAPLPRPAARAARHPATAILLPLAAPRRALGEPAPRLRGGIRDASCPGSWRRSSSRCCSCGRDRAGVVHRDRAGVTAQRQSADVPRSLTSTAARSPRRRRARRSLLVAAAVTLILVAASIAVFSSRVRPDRLRPPGGLSAGRGGGVGTATRRTRIPTTQALDLRRARTSIRRSWRSALVPLSWLPTDLAAFLVFLASVAALLGAVALVGVRDVRCYAAVLLWAPTWNSLDTLNVSVGARARRRAPLAVSLDALAAGCDARGDGVDQVVPLAACSSGSVSRDGRRGRDPRGRARVRPHAGVVGGDRVRRPRATTRSSLARVADQENYSIVAIADEVGIGSGRARARGGRGRRCSSLRRSGVGARGAGGSRVHARRRRDASR